MLTDLEIENFQSIHRLSLKLGKLTVVTGATGSGKTAVLRALRLLSFNARGISYITRGEKACKVLVQDDQGLGAVIVRGGRGQDAYALDVLGETKKFTKLGGQVPAEVSQCLELSELNFAAQFDRPFLLDSSGGEIARVLGRLTNVTLLFDAAREANRRRLEVMGDLKRAEANLSALTEAAQKFRGMKDRQEAVSQAEVGMEWIAHFTARRDRCHALTVRLEAAQGALKAAVPPEVPDGARLDELAEKLARVRDLHARLGSGKEAAEDAYVRSMQAIQDEQGAHERMHEVLAEAGQCPTCGASVT